MRWRILLSDQPTARRLRRGEGAWPLVVEEPGQLGGERCDVIFETALVEIPLLVTSTRNSGHVE